MKSVNGISSNNNIPASCTLRKSEKKTTYFSVIRSNESNLFAEGLAKTFFQFV